MLSIFRRKRGKNPLPSTIKQPDNKHSDTDDADGEPRSVKTKNPDPGREPTFHRRFPNQILLVFVTPLLTAYLITTPLQAAPGETTLVSRGDPSLTPVLTGAGPRDRFGLRVSSPSLTGVSVFASRSKLSGYAQEAISRQYQDLYQIYLHDPATARTELISQTASGRAGDASSHNPAITADGRFVVYATEAKNFVDTPDHGEGYVLVLDRQTGETELIGATVRPRYSSPQISADGAVVIFTARGTDASTHLYAYYRSTQTTVRVDRSMDGDYPNSGVGDGIYGGNSPIGISGDGRFVSYLSRADNIVPADTNGDTDVFVADLQTLSTERVSVSTSGTQGDNNSTNAAISKDGRFVTFTSYAENLVSDDTNGKGDVFVYDRQTGEQTRISESTAGEQADDNSLAASISADGRFVTFQSNAQNLIENDPYRFTDIFLHDRTTGTTELISKSATGEITTAMSGGGAISEDGRYVSFSSPAENLVPGDDSRNRKLIIHDRNSGLNVNADVYSIDYVVPTEIPAKNLSTVKALTEDASVVLFETRSTNVVNVESADPAWTRVYAFDTRTNAIEVLGPAHGQNTGYPVISPEGNFVALVNANRQVQLTDRRDGLISILSQFPDGDPRYNCRPESISRNGEFVAMSCNVVSNDRFDPRKSMLVDTANNEIEQYPGVWVDSVRHRSVQLSDSGRYVVFRYSGGELDSRVTDDKPHLYVQDRVADTIELISLSTSGDVSNGEEFQADISADGRYVVFESEGSNLAAYSGAGRFQPRVFLRDRLSGSTSLICRNINNRAVNGPCRKPTISADGNRISYSSTASNIVADDRNGSDSDVFLYERTTGITKIVSVSSDGTQSQARSDSQDPIISGNGKFVAFGSQAGLVAADKWVLGDVYLRELELSDGDGTGYFSARPVIVAEDAGVARVVVSLDPVSNDASSVTIATQSGTAMKGADFYGTSRTLNFPAGTATASIDIDILNDTVVESDESFAVRLFRATGTTQIAEEYATVRIIDDDGDNGDPVYSDVPADYPGFDEILRFYEAGIAGRCGESPLRFCPDNYLRRDVMALWLGRAKYGANFQPPSATGRRYTDVPANFWAAGWLELADRDRVYRGCGDFSTACPSQSMTRAQLAVYTVYARYGRNYPLPAATGIFSDIPPTFWAARHIEQLARDGVIIDGCNESNDRFCPSAVASRSTAAVWTVRAFGF